jgi:hypothetical protein
MGKSTLYITLRMGESTLSNRCTWFEIGLTVLHSLQAGVFFGGCANVILLVILM